MLPTPPRFFPPFILALWSLLSLPLTLIGGKSVYLRLSTAHSPQQPIHRTAKDEADYWACFSWASCLSQLQLRTDCVFFGDSITRGGDFQAAYPQSSICNLGYSGNTLHGMSYRVNQISAVHPQKVFLMAGVNDILNSCNETTFTERYRELLKKIRAEVPDAELIVQSILPVDTARKPISNATIRQYNQHIRSLCEEEHLSFVDLYSLYADKDGNMPPQYSKDGIHLHPEAYRIWFDAIRAHIPHATADKTESEPRNKRT